jgi:acetoacetate decarboxylase
MALGIRRASKLFIIPRVGGAKALPVMRLLEGRQHLWDMTLSVGEVVHDYLEAESSSVR